MEEIDELGHFWLADNEKDALSGRLRFHPGDGGRLSLVGIFESGHRHDSGEMVRIHGWIGSRQITLDQCFLRKSSMRSPGIQECEYHVNQLFVGHHLNGNLEFQEVVAEWSDFDGWVARSGLDETYSRFGEAGPLYQLTFNPDEKRTASFEGGQVSLTTLWSHAGDLIRGVTFRGWPALNLVYRDMQSFEAIRRDVGRIQSLVSLCVDAPAVTHRLTLRRPDVRALMLSGEDAGHPQDIDFLAPMLRYESPDERRHRHPYEMLLTFEELGGVQAVARWLDVSRRFQRALDSLMSVQRARRMYAENRFLNVTYAAEAFHRILYGGTQMGSEEFEALFSVLAASVPEEHRSWFDGRFRFANEPSLRKRMRQLAARAGRAAKVITGNIDDWAFSVSQARNDLTHLGSSSSRLTGSELRSLTDSVYAVTRACMLLECGVSQEVLARKSESASSVWLAPRVQAVIAKTRSRA